ncbi:FAD/NAD(P)-binding protein [Kosakonia sp. ML.JS2a]|uniref:FAD/NAD(P)-binding protein n=1 Tax=Kosakonia sp. ML.JS2a TaxID=2980557 RepID=UPI0021DAF9F9|nr:FAD/NAD(P)-binding protein [Kosakonia sp. ML.JS2a]UXY13385.1 FAD/NAD(P)-binding protein [Kosakonia sp. ML.JS2a]
MNVEPQVVIVGGGFSGAAAAIQLLRLAPKGVRVMLLEPRAVPGAGVAYSTTEPSHRINVPAVRMQLADEEEGAFDRWYRRQPTFADDPQALREEGSVYPQRAQFGRYVAQRFADTARASDGRLIHLREQALAFDNRGVTTDTGRLLKADLLVLAMSHPPPSLPQLAASFRDHPALIADPWRPDALTTIAPDARVAVMGTGLTMADAVAAITRPGHRGSVTAFSRRGLLSRSNLSGESVEWPGDYRQGTLRQRLRRVREDISRAAEQGLPWQVVLDAVRNQGQTIWQELAFVDRQRFLRHLRSYWDVHRYRIAPQTAEVLSQRIDDGSLNVQAARLTALAGDARTLTLTLSPRRGRPYALTVDHLILTTGPAHNALTESQPLLQELTRRGLIRPDALGLGLDVDTRSHAIGREGQSTPTILVCGPAARGRFGELMGLPQVADHAVAVAGEALAMLGFSLPARCSMS